MKGLPVKGQFLIKIPRIFFNFLLVVIAIGSLAAVNLPAYAAPIPSSQQLQIESVFLDKQNNLLTISGLGNRPEATKSNYTVLKLPNPYRLIIDVPDAVNGLNSDNVAIQQQGIDKVTLTQHSGPFYNAVRITVYVDSANVLNNLSTSFVDNDLQIHLTNAPVTVGPPELPPNAIANGPNLGHALKDGSKVRFWESPLDIPPGLSVVEDVFYRDRQLVVVSGNKGAGKLKVKNQFVLKNPQRLVIDIDNSSVVSKAILGTINVNDDPSIKQIRVGQFDKETVRLVIEANDPERFSVYYPSADQKLLAISAINNANMITLPQGTPLGTLDKITIDEEGGATVIRLSASSPLIHRMSKKNDEIRIDLLNIAARPGVVSYDQKAFEHIEALSVNPLVIGQPNSQFVVDLNNPRWDVETRLSVDNQTLEIALIPSIVPAGNIAKMPFPARIVVDSGHGGKDKGAMRRLDGKWVLEKDLNLNMAHKVKKALEARGAKVIMTRSTDQFLPLSTITAITNRHKPDVFVSVHHNASTNPGLAGIETYYYTWKSKALADKIHKQLTSHVNANNRNVRRAKFYVIHHTNVPAVLCEVGYISNSTELRALTTTKRQDAAANAIADGVAQYLRSKVAASAK